MSSLLRKMREKAGFSDTEQIIADYLLKNYRDLSVMSTRELARRTYSSSAAIVRFSQKMGFKGFPDFKVKFLSEILQDQGNHGERRVSQQNTVAEIADIVLSSGVKTLKETHAMLNPADLNRALHYLRHAGHIGVYAMGDNINLAGMAATNFIMVGKYVSVHPSMNIQFLEAYGAPKDYVGLFLSRTGENRMLVEIARQLSRQGNHIICITAAPGSTLASLANVTLKTASAETLEEFGPRVFQLGALYYLTSLYGVLLTHCDYKGAVAREKWLQQNFRY